MTWLIESRWHAHKKYFAGSIIIIIIRIDQNLQDSLDAASTAGDAPKTEADPILPQTQKCSVLHYLRGIVAAMLSCQQSSSFIQLVCRKSLRVRSCSYARSHSGSVGVPNAMMADHLTAVLQAFAFMAAGPHRRSRLQLHRLP